MLGNHNNTPQYGQSVDLAVLTVCYCIFTRLYIQFSDLFENDPLTGDVAYENAEHLHTSELLEKHKKNDEYFSNKIVFSHI